MASSCPGLSDNIKEIVIDHRKNVAKFNPKLAETVGLLRVRKELCGQPPNSWRKNKPVVREDISSLDPITFKEMTPDVVYKGRVIHLTNVDIPTHFEFESADTFTTQHVSAVLLLQDRNGDVNRGFVYNYVLPTLIWEYEEDDEIAKMGDVDANNVQDHLGISSKISVADPELKTGEDGKLALVVINPENLIVRKIPSNQKSCRYCMKEFPATANSCCSRCHEAFYCSKDCQSNDWYKMKHKIVCITKEAAGKRAVEKKYKPPGLRPRWTVYQLEQSIRVDLCPSLEPSHVNLRHDYGFANCASINDEGKLLGLYKGMVDIMKVDMVMFHKAMLANRLRDFINQCFGKYPNQNKGEYYKIFLKNPSVVRWE